MSNNTNNDMLVKILKVGVYFVALIPLVIFKEFISPFHFGKVLVFRSIIEIMAVFYLVLILRDRKYLPKLNPILIVLTIFTAIFGISTLTSINQYLSFWGSLERMGGFWTFAHFLLFYVILLSVFKRREDWLNLLKVSVFVGFLSALYGFGQKTEIKFFIGSEGDRLRIFGTIGNAALFGGYQLVILFLSITLLFSSWIPSRQKIYFVIAAMANILAILMTAVRGAILGMTVGIVLFAFLYAYSQRSHYAKQARKIFLLFMVLIVLFIGFSFAFKSSSFVKNSGYLSRMTDMSFKSFTVQTRIWAWRAGIRGWRETPKTILLGWGPENFNVPFSKHFNPNFYQGVGSETLFDRAHNMFVEVLVTMGLAALLAYIAIFAVAYKLIWRFILSSRKVPEPEQNQSAKKDPLIGIGLFSLVTAYVVHNFFFFDTSANFIIFFTVLAFISYLTYSRPSSGEQEHEKPSQGSASSLIWFLMAALLIFISIFIYKTNIFPIKANYATTRAIIRSWNGDHEGAVAKYKEALSYDVAGKYEIRHRFAQYVLGRTNSKKLDENDRQLIDFTLKEVQKNADETNQDYVPYLYLSRLNIILGKEDPQLPANKIALEHSLKALEISPTFVRTYYEIAQYYLNIKNFTKAIGYFQEAADLNPEVGISHWYLGITHLELNNFKEGFESVEMALKKGYKLSEQEHLRLINAYLKVNNLEKVKGLYESLIAINSGNPQYFASLATTYANLGDLDNAEKAARQAAKLDSSFEPEARAFIESLGRKF